MLWLLGHVGLWLFQAFYTIIRMWVRTFLSVVPSLCAGLFWLGSCGGILSYQLTRPITTSAAIMHTRVYAQVCPFLPHTVWGCPWQL